MVKLLKNIYLCYFTSEKENFIGGKTNVFLLQWTEFCLSSSIHRGFLLFSNERRFSSLLQWIKLWLSSSMDGGLPISFNGWSSVFYIFLSSSMGFASLTQWMEFFLRGGFSFSMDGVSVSFYYIPRSSKDGCFPLFFNV